MNKRQLLTAGGLGLSFAMVPLVFFRNVEAETDQSVLDLQGRWREFQPQDFELVEKEPKLVRTNAEWRAELTRAQYDILFNEGTERPFSSSFNDNKQKGIYVCKACSLPLFTSEMKFDSGTGWPSFFTSIPDHLETKRDFNLIYPRTEYHCVKCQGHQGHLFGDGPRPTKQRWCNNGLALRFVV